MFFKQLSLYFGLGHHSFDCKLWQSRPKIRKCFLKDILESQMAIGMGEKEVISKFGIDRKIYSSGVWSYSIPGLMIANTQRVLNFYFDTRR